MLQFCHIYSCFLPFWQYNSAYMARKKRTGVPLKIKTIGVIQRKFKKFIKICDKKKVPYTVERWAWCLGVSRVTLLAYCKGERKSVSQEMIDELEKCRAYIVADKMEQMLKGKRPQTGAIFDFVNNEGYSNTSEVVNKGEQTININITKYV